MSDNKNNNYIIIQAGEIPPPPPEWTGELKCKHCNCVFKTKIKSLKTIQTGMSEWEKATDCPTCNRTVYVT